MQIFSNEKLFSIFKSSILRTLKDNFPVPFFIESLLEHSGIKKLINEWSILKKESQILNVLNDREISKDEEFQHFKSTVENMDQNFSKSTEVFMCTIKFLKSEGYIRETDQGNFTLTEKGLNEVNSSSDSVLLS